MSKVFSLEDFCVNVNALSIPEITPEVKKIDISGIELKELYIDVSDIYVPDLGQIVKLKLVDVFDPEDGVIVDASFMNAPMAVNNTAYMGLNRYGEYKLRCTSIPAFYEFQWLTNLTMEYVYTDAIVFGKLPKLVSIAVKMKESDRRLIVPIHGNIYNVVSKPVKEANGAHGEYIDYESQNLNVCTGNITSMSDAAFNTDLIPNVDFSRPHLLDRFMPLPREDFNPGQEIEYIERFMPKSFFPVFLTDFYKKGEPGSKFRQRLMQDIDLNNLMVTQVSRDYYKVISESLNDEFPCAAGHDNHYLPILSALKSNFESILPYGTPEAMIKFITDDRPWLEKAKELAQDNYYQDIIDYVYRVYLRWLMQGPLKVIRGGGQ